MRQSNTRAQAPHLDTLTRTLPIDLIVEADFSNTTDLVVAFRHKFLQFLFEFSVICNHYKLKISATHLAFAMQLKFLENFRAYHTIPSA